MGDRRKGDRRAPEEGVFRIEKKKVAIYAILIGILIFAIVLNIWSWTAYIRYKLRYDTLVNHYYNEDSNTNTQNERISENSNYSCDISIKGNKKSIKAGESVEFDIKVSNINAGEGIKSFETYVEYDTNLFECRINSDEEYNWTKSGFLEGYLTMYKSDLQANSEDQIIAKFVFTAKENVPSGSYNALLKNIKLTSGDDQIINLEDQTININVE